MLKKTMWTIPNILTLARLALLPFMIALFFVPFAWASWVCLALYVIGAVTDFFDGWIARKYKQTSEFGAFMDPLSDKIFVITLLLMLVASGRIEGIWVMGVVVIIIREFTVSGVREYLGAKDLKLPVTNLAKWKTAAQMLATGILIVGPYILWGYGQLLGQVVLTGASILTVITGWGYLKAGLDHMKKS